MVLPRWAIASRSVVNFTPSSSTIGSATRDQDTTQLRIEPGFKLVDSEIVPAQKSPDSAGAFEFSKSEENQYRGITGPPKR